MAEQAEGPTEGPANRASGDQVTNTPLVLSHHRPEEYERCVTFGRWHVCRRCLTLYPLALVVMALSLAGSLWPGSLDPILLAVLPLPAVIDWWAEHLGRIGYDPHRQILVTIPAAVALGQGFALYVDNPTDPLFWATVLVYGGSCLAVAMWRFLDDNAL